jgi:glycosyltransferase involved in cell wall biosynthesis
MRILYVIMAYGPQIIASEVHSELGRYFRQQGHRFEVLSLEDYSETGEAGAQSFPGEEHEVKIHTIRFKNSMGRRVLRKCCRAIFKYGFFLELLWGYVSFFRKHPHRFDILHVEAAYPLGAVAALAARLVKIPFVINLQGADVMRLPAYDYGYARYFFPRLLLRYTFRKAAGVRANSEITGEIAREYGTGRHKLRVILRNISETIYPPPALDLQENKQRKQAELREKYGLNPGPILIAYSRLHPFKGLDWLLKAMPELRERLGQVNLLICGPGRRTPQFGDYRHYLEELARKLGVQEEVVFTGKIDFSLSRDYLAGADLLVIPSVVEALNKVAIEAAAVGTPSVITETTGIGLHAEQAGIGLRVAAKDPKALAKGVCEGLSRKEEMGRNGPAFASNMTSARIGQQLLDFYEECLHRQTRLAYIAYPSSLTLKSANAIQTYTTCRELKKVAPRTLVLIPRLPFRPTRFADSAVRARHLPRLPFNFFNNFGPLKVIPWSYLERAWFALLAGIWLLLQRLTGRGCRVIYSRDVIVTYLLVRYWRRILNAKIIYEAHDLEQRNPSRAKNARLRRWLEKVDRVVLDKADGVVSLTGAFLDYTAEQKLRDPRRPNAVIPDAFDSEVYKPLSQAECRAQLGLPQDAFIIVYSGLTFAYRNLDKLQEAFAAFLREQKPHAYLYLVGGRPFEQKEMREQAQKLGLEERVKCVGQINPDKVNLYLNAASLLAIPDTVTDITASPLKMFEYAAVGRPVLLPDIAALREILGDAEAFYFQRGNVADMTRAITTACCQPEEAARRGEAASARVAAHTYGNRALSILEFVKKLA